MSEPRALVTTSVQTVWAAEGVGCLGAIAGTALVCGLVGLVASQNGPRGLDVIVPWLWVTTLVFGAATAWAWARSRRPFALTESPDGTLSLTIGADTWSGPFTSEQAFWTQRLKGIPKWHLTLHLYDSEGKHVCSLSESWGALHGAPPGWREARLSPRGVPGPAWVAATDPFLEDVRQEIEARASS